VTIVVESNFDTVLVTICPSVCPSVKQFILQYSFTHLYNKTETLMAMLPSIVMLSVLVKKNQN